MKPELAHATLVDSVEHLGVEVIATAHGPVLDRSLVEAAFRRIRTLPSLPELAQPDQHDLDAMFAHAMQAGAAQAPTS